MLKRIKSNSNLNEQSDQMRPSTMMETTVEQKNSEPTEERTKLQLLHSSRWIGHSKSAEKMVSAIGRTLSSDPKRSTGGRAGNGMDSRSSSSSTDAVIANVIPPKSFSKKPKTASLNNLRHPGIMNILQKSENQLASAVEKSSVPLDFAQSPMKFAPRIKAAPPMTQVPPPSPGTPSTRKGVPGQKVTKTKFVKNLILKMSRQNEKSRKLTPKSHYSSKSTRHSMGEDHRDGGGGGTRKSLNQKPMISKKLFSTITNYRIHNRKGELPKPYAGMRKMTKDKIARFSTPDFLSKYRSMLKTMKYGKFESSSSSSSKKGTGFSSFRLKAIRSIDHRSTVIKVPKCYKKNKTVEEDKGARTPATLVCQKNKTEPVTEVSPWPSVAPQPKVEPSSLVKATEQEEAKTKIDAMVMKHSTTTTATTESGSNTVQQQQTISVQKEPLMGAMGGATKIVASGEESSVEKTQPEAFASAVEGPLGKQQPQEAASKPESLEEETVGQPPSPPPPPRSPVVEEQQQSKAAKPAGGDDQSILSSTAAAAAPSPVVDGGGQQVPDAITNNNINKKPWEPEPVGREKEQPAPRMPSTCAALRSKMATVGAEELVEKLYDIFYCYENLILKYKNQNKNAAGADSLNKNNNNNNNIPLVKEAPVTESTNNKEVEWKKMVALPPPAPPPDQEATVDDLEVLYDELADLNTGINTLRSSYGSIIRSLMAMQQRRTKKTWAPMPTIKPANKDQPVAMHEVADRATTVNYEEKYNMDRFLDPQEREDVFKTMFDEVQEINNAMATFRTFFDKDAYFQKEKYQQSGLKYPQCLVHNCIKVISEMNKAVAALLRAYNTDLLDMFRLKSNGS